MLNLKNKPNLVAILIIIPVAIVLSILLNMSIEYVKYSRLDERFQTLMEDVNTRCRETDYFADRDEDWEEEYVWYSESLTRHIEIIDERHNVFAAVYTDGGECLSKREATYVGSPFEPYAYPEIAKALERDISGLFDVVFTPSPGIDRPMRFYFRKVPSYLDKGYLTAMVAIPFTMDNATLSFELYLLIYVSYVLAIISISILIFVFTKYAVQYKNLLKVITTVEG